MAGLSKDFRRLAISLPPLIATSGPSIHRPTQTGRPLRSWRPSVVGVADDLVGCFAFDEVEGAVG